LFILQSTVKIGGLLLFLCCVDNAVYLYPYLTLT